MKFLGWRTKDGKGLVVECDDNINLEVQNIEEEISYSLTLYVCKIKYGDLARSKRLLFFEDGRVYENGDHYIKKHDFDLVKPSYLDKQHKINRIPFIL